MQVNLFEMLPIDIFNVILQFVGSRAIHPLREVNKLFRDGVANTQLWKYFILHDFGILVQDGSFAEYRDLLLVKFNEQHSELDRISQLLTRNCSFELAVIMSRNTDPLSEGPSTRLKSLLSDQRKSILNKVDGYLNSVKPDSIEAVLQQYDRQELFLNSYNLNIIGLVIDREKQAWSPQGAGQENNREIDLKFMITRLTNDMVELLYPHDIAILNIACNGLVRLPNNLGVLISLKKLALNDNKLSKLPDNFDWLSNLKQLNINNNLFKPIPNVIFNFRMLESLDIGNYKPSLTRCICCESVGVHTDGNELSVLPSLRQLPNLMELKAASIGLSNVDKLADCGELIWANLCHNKISHLPSNLKGAIKNYDNGGLWLTNNPISFKVRSGYFDFDQFLQTVQIYTSMPLKRQSIKLLNSLWFAASLVATEIQKMGAVNALRHFSAGAASVSLFSHDERIEQDDDQAQEMRQNRL